MYGSSPPNKEDGGLILFDDLAKSGTPFVDTGRRVESQEIVWRESRRGTPCIICESEGWCKASECGNWAVCRRSERHPTYGSGRAKDDTIGAPYWTFRLTAKPERTNEWCEARYDHKVEKGQKADSEAISLVYAAVLRNLALAENHRQDLHRRGLPNTDWLVRRGYRSLPQRGCAAVVQALIREGLESKLPGVPGFIVAKNPSGHPYWTLAGSAGLLIPVIDAEHRIVALMIRRDDGKEPKYVYFTSSGRDFKTGLDRGGASPGSPVHVPPITVKNPKLVRVTEGALKADIATKLSGILTIGLPGVHACKPGIETLQALGATTARVAYDADARTNPMVADHLQRLLKRLRAAGIATELEVWDQADGKGIDDLLAAGKQPKVLTDPAEIDKEVADILDSAHKGKNRATSLFTASGSPVDVRAAVPIQNEPIQAVPAGIANEPNIAQRIVDGATSAPLNGPVPWVMSLNEIMKLLHMEGRCLRNGKNRFGQISSDAPQLDWQSKCCAHLVISETILNAVWGAYYPSSSSPDQILSDFQFDDPRINNDMSYCAVPVRNLDGVIVGILLIALTGTCTDDVLIGESGFICCNNWSVDPHQIVIARNPRETLSLLSLGIPSIGLADENLDPQLLVTVLQDCKDSFDRGCLGNTQPRSQAACR